MSNKINGYKVYKLGERSSFTEHLKPKTGLQDYAKIAAECKHTGKLFNDTEFKLPLKHKGKVVRWIRPRELDPGARFEIDGFSRFDVVQGQLGNCWLLAPMASLTLYPQLFHQIVPANQVINGEGYTGAFFFRLWHLGRFIEIVVDDRLAYDRDGRLIFCNSSTDGEYWPALLEKAVAKLYGSYSRLESGDGNEGLVPLTGGLPERHDIDFLMKGTLRSILRRAKTTGSPMAACIIRAGAEQEEVVDNGLVNLHAYAITGSMWITPADRSPVYLLRLRNPWGQFEWNGAWSDGSPNWNLLTQRQKDTLGYVAHEDGEFFISQDDFADNFTRLEITHVEELSDPRWALREYTSYWELGSTAGGPPLVRKRSFLCNPTYLMLVEVAQEVTVSLQQDARRAKGETECGLGVHILKVPNGMLPARQVDSLRTLPRRLNIVSGGDIRLDRMLDVAAFHDYSKVMDVTLRVNLDPGVYAVIPSTAVKKTRNFILRIAQEFLRGP